MKYCKDCVGFDECKTTGRTVEFAVDEGVCLDFDERKPQTNADRIRAMSDEELRFFICGNAKCEHCNFEGSTDCLLKEWLKQPYKENEE